MLLLFSNSKWSYLMKENNFDQIVKEHPVILFYDGVCNICNFSVQLILKQESSPKISFCAIQSDFAKWLGEEHNVAIQSLNSLIFFQHERFSNKSTALLRILPYMKWYWQPLLFFRIFPAVVLDPVYDFIARNRYRWFGKKESCMVPTPEIRQRFLDV